jgi:hypothetical protein
MASGVSGVFSSARLGSAGAGLIMPLAPGRLMYGRFCGRGLADGAHGLTAEGALSKFTKSRFEVDPKEKDIGGGGFRGAFAVPCLGLPLESRFDIAAYGEA